MKFIWLPFYLFSDLLAKLIFIGSGCDVWSRNSYRLGYASPPSSDLDITVYVKNNSWDFRQVQLRLRVLKRLCPLIREVNFYTDHDLDFIMRQINPCELDRDPELKDKFRYTLNKSDAQKLVFLMKNYLNDLENLSERRSMRTLRWRNLLADAGFSSSSEDILCDIATSIEKLSDSNLRKSQVYQILRDRDFELEGSLWYLNPVGYIIRSFKHFNYIAIPGDSLTVFQQNLLLENVKWEVWGLFTQIYLCDNFIDYKNHFENLKLLCSSKMSNEKLREVDKTFNQFFEIMERYER